MRLIALERREGKAANDSRLLREARRRVRPAAERGRRAAARRGAAADRRPRRRAPRRRRREPSSSTPTGAPSHARGASRAGARRSPRPLFLHRRLVTQSGGERTREVGWVQSSAMLVRRDRRPSRSATWTPTSSSTRTRPTSASACATRAGRSSSSPRPGPSTTTRWRATRPEPIAALVEFHRNRDLYLRKHKGPSSRRADAAAARLPLPAARRVAARSFPATRPAATCAHARQALTPRPRRGHPRGGGGLQPRAEPSTPEAPIGIPRASSSRCSASSASRVRRGPAGRVLARQSRSSAVAARTPHRSAIRDGRQLRRRRPALVARRGSRVA